MKANDLKVGQVADELKVDPRNVTGWRKGERGPTLEQAQSLARLLGDPEAVLWWDWPPGVDPAAPDPAAPEPTAPDPGSAPQATWSRPTSEDGADSAPRGLGEIFSPARETEAAEGADDPVHANPGNVVPQTPSRRRWPPPVELLILLGVVLVVAVLVAVWLVGRSSAPPHGSPSGVPSTPMPGADSTSVDPSAADPTAGQLEEGPTVALRGLSCKDVVAVPASATSVAEVQGSQGAPTFSDPRKLCGAGPKVDPLEKVQVVCRLLSTLPTSVVPDGYWYLVASGAGRGRFAAANTFLNGDPLGAGNRTNTDTAVPRCEING